MEWMEAIRTAIGFMEEHMEDDRLTAEMVADAVHISSFHFQKGFSVVCGITITEYIRNRRLSLAGKDLQSEGSKVIDIALKYGYESTDSFSKAFTRFHGITPMQAKKAAGELKNFLPLKVTLSMKGGFEMDCRIVKKPAFTVIASSVEIKNDQGPEVCPRFWGEHFSKGDGEYIKGVYGVSLDIGKPGSFIYLIADEFNPEKEYPERFEKVVIPENTWAVFPVIGPMPDAFQKVFREIYTEWLPGNPDYECVNGSSVEFYSCADQYPNGTADEKYYSEIWLPVRPKK